METSSRNWVDFFLQAGIPPNESASYALIFAENRIQKNMLLDLNKEYLRDMGITVLGDIIAILKYAKIAHETDTRASLLKQQTTKISTIKSSKQTVKKSLSSQPLSTKGLLDKYTKKYNEALTSPNLEKNEKESKQEQQHVTETRNAVVKTSSVVIKDNQATVPKTKKTIFDRLGDGSVSSTTSDSTKESSIFNRLGTSEVSSSTPGKKLLMNSTSTTSKTLSSPIIKKNEESTKKTTPTFLESRSLENLTIVADFEEEEEPKKKIGSLSSRFKTIQPEVKLNIKAEDISQMKFPLKRKDTGDSNAAPKQKKVRFSGVQQRIIPSNEATISLVNTNKNLVSQRLPMMTNKPVSAVKSRIGTTCDSQVNISTTAPNLQRRPIKERITIKERNALNSGRIKTGVHARLG